MQYFVDLSIKIQLHIIVFKYLTIALWRHLFYIITLNVCHITP